MGQPCTLLPLAPGRGWRLAPGFRLGLLMLLILAEIFHERHRRAIVVLRRFRQRHPGMVGLLSSRRTIEIGGRCFAPCPGQHRRRHARGPRRPNLDWRCGHRLHTVREGRTYDLNTLRGLRPVERRVGGRGHRSHPCDFDSGPRKASGLSGRSSFAVRREEISAIAASQASRTHSDRGCARARRSIVACAPMHERTLRLYRLSAGPAATRRDLETYVSNANQLAANPRWYNTLTTNCTTAVFQIARGRPTRYPLDWRVLASGHFADYAYDHGGGSKALPFAELKENATSTSGSRRRQGSAAAVLPETPGGIRTRRRPKLYRSLSPASGGLA